MIEGVLEPNPFRTTPNCTNTYPAKNESTTLVVPKVWKEVEFPKTSHTKPIQIARQGQNNGRKVAVAFVQQGEVEKGGTMM